MTATATVRRLDTARADRITAKLRGASDLLLDLVVEAYAGRVWEVYGLESWAAYAAAKVPALAIIGRGLPLEQRRDAVAVLRGRGLSLRAVSDVLGIAPNTARTDAAAAGVQLAEVVGMDGVRQAATRAAAPRRRRRAVPLTDRIVTLLAGGGPRTVLEVARELRTDRTMVAPALTRLTAGGRVGYLAPERRGLFGRYVVEGGRS